MCLGGAAHCADQAILLGYVTVGGALTLFSRFQLSVCFAFHGSLCVCVCVDDVKQPCHECATSVKKISKTSVDFSFHSA